MFGDCLVGAEELEGHAVLQGVADGAKAAMRPGNGYRLEAFGFAMSSLTSTTAPVPAGYADLSALPFPYDSCAGSARSWPVGIRLQPGLVACRSQPSKSQTSCLPPPAAIRPAWPAGQPEN